MNTDAYPDVSEQSLPLGSEALIAYAVLNHDVYSEDRRVLADRQWIEDRVEALIKMCDSISAVEARQQAQREWLTQVFLRVLRIRDEGENSQAIQLLRRTRKMGQISGEWVTERDRLLRNLPMLRV